VDIIDSFPQECQTVIEAFKVVYYNDKVAREEGMSDPTCVSRRMPNEHSTIGEPN
jgi:hypothetical protein